MNDASNYPPPRLIGIHGLARSGKDTVANFLVDSHFYQRYAFADPLRRFVADITGIPFSSLIDGPAKEETYEPLGQSPRYMMQTLGTEWGRQMIHPLIWIRAAQVQWESCKQFLQKSMVIPDVRFENEADFIRENGGQMWFIKRDGALAVNEHVSEAGVQVKPGDAVINNDGTINDLYDAIDDLIFLPA